MLLQQRQGRKKPEPNRTEPNRTDYYDVNKNKVIIIIKKNEKLKLARLQQWKNQKPKRTRSKKKKKFFLSFLVCYFPACFCHATTTTATTSVVWCCCIREIGTNPANLPACLLVVDYIIGKGLKLVGWLVGLFVCQANVCLGLKSKTSTLKNLFFFKKRITYTTLTGWLAGWLAGWVTIS